MVFRKPLVHWLLLLTICLLGSGCAELSAWRDTAPRRTETAHVLRPPAPAPALCIPVPGSKIPVAAAQPQNTETLTEAVEKLPELIPAAVMPVETTVEDDPLASLRALRQKAQSSYADLPAYTARLRRREVIGGRRRPEEIIQLKFRQQPWSLHLKWIGDEAHGRQVFHVKGRDNDAVHLFTAGGDKFLAPSTQRVKITLDGAWIKANSRHPLARAGLGPLIERFAQHVDQASATSTKLKDLGVLKRPELEQSVHAVLQAIPPAAEALLPHGGQRLWFFDTATSLPVLIITHDANGEEVEYYGYQNIQRAALTDSDFDPTAP